MLLIKALIVLLINYNIRNIEGVDSETIKKCCNAGTNHTLSGLKCTTVQLPEHIKEKDKNICLNSVEICCKTKESETLCEIGKTDARNGVSCTTKEQSGTKKECCEKCLLGINSGKGGNCQDILSLGTVFTTCCEEIFSTVSPKPTLISSTTTRISRTMRSASTDNLPAIPPLENFCDIENICAQICVPMKDSYRCDCNKGFSLMGDNKSCKPDGGGRSTTINGIIKKDKPNKCHVNNPCEQKCIDTGVDIKCECYQGYELTKDKKTCKDIDECLKGVHECVEGEECVNESGGYYCEDPNFSEDSMEYSKKCSAGYKFNGLKSTCDDIDECEIGLMCSRPKVCVNTIGSFSCEDDILQCPPGYQYKPAVATCVDIDECVTGENDCNKESQTCLNTKGNYTCIDNVSKKTCPPGFKKNMFTQICDDINECEDSIELCPLGEECVNEIGGHTCVQKTIHPDKTPNIYTSPAYTVTIRTSTPVTTKPRTQLNPKPTKSITSKPTTTKRSTTPHVSKTTTTTRSTPKVITSTTIKPTTRPTTTQPISCARGFVMSLYNNRCEDYNECENDVPCDSNQACHNTAGSYYCDCKPGFTQDHITSACVDINECQIGTHDCTEMQRCDNTLGSYYCARMSGCGTGYTLNYASGLCEDDNECILGTHNCGDLGSGFTCRNTLGSYRCDPVRPPRVFSSSTTTTKRTTRVYSVPPYISGQQKKCLPGYKMDYNGNCQDIDECLSNPCKRGESCINMHGRYQCYTKTQCKVGYELDEAGDFCIDVNECSKGTHKCSPTQICKNGDGYYTCECPPGHHLNPLTNTCEDIDECKFYAVCHMTSNCINTAGSYRCECKPGFRKVGDSCEDIDECRMERGLCEHTCVNVWGSYRCACRPGFSLNKDNRTCTDIDECERFKENKLCIGHCQNIPGSYTCTCPPGYRLGYDGRTCQDIDECERNICPRSDDICINTRGSYKCYTIDCPTNYIRDIQHKSRCKRPAYFCDTRDIQCILMPEQFTYHYITIMSNLPIPNGQLPFFQIRGPKFVGARAEFVFRLISVNCPQTIPSINERYFMTDRDNYNSMQLYLARSITGPQEAELEVQMKLFDENILKHTFVSKIFIIVAEYSF